MAADGGHTLRTVRDLLAPGGLFAVVEMAGLPRFLPENAPAETTTPSPPQPLQTTAAARSPNRRYSGTGHCSGSGSPAGLPRRNLRRLDIHSLPWINRSWVNQKF